MGQDQPSPGIVLKAKYLVTESDLASVVSPDSVDKYPAVFATARMVAFMEITSARIIVPYLKPGQLSVGVRVDVTHSKPTPPGETVEVTSTFVGVEDNLWVFDVVCRDAKGVVGRARHGRGLVEQARLEAASRKRRAGGSKL